MVSTVFRKLNDINYFQKFKWCQLFFSKNLNVSKNLNAIKYFKKKLNAINCFQIFENKINVLN